MIKISSLAVIGLCLVISNTVKAIELWSNDKHKFEIKGDLHYGAFYHVLSIDEPRAPNYDPASVRGKGEIDFVYKGKINEDLSFGAKLEARLSSFGQDDSKLTDIELDETYIELKSKRYGKLVLGSDKGVAGDSQVRATEFLAKDLNSIEGQDFRVFSKIDGPKNAEGDRTRYFDTKDETDIDYDEDVHKIIYYTPCIIGFQLGVSYAPNLDRTGSGQNNQGLEERTVENDEGENSEKDIKDGVALSITFENERAGLKFDASSGLLIAKRVGGEADPFAWNIGGKIGTEIGQGQVSLGGGYLVGQDASGIGEDDRVFIIGIAYEQNSWKTGIHYGHAKNTARSSNGRTEETTNEIEVGGSYRFTDYMAISTMVEYVQSKVEETSLPSKDANGVGVGIIFTVNF